MIYYYTRHLKSCNYHICEYTVHHFKNITCFRPHMNIYPIQNNCKGAKRKPREPSSTWSLNMKELERCAVQSDYWPEPDSHFNQTGQVKYSQLSSWYEPNKLYIRVSQSNRCKRRKKVGVQHIVLAQAIFWCYLFLRTWKHSMTVAKCCPLSTLWSRMREQQSIQRIRLLNCGNCKADTKRKV